MPKNSKSSGGGTGNRFGQLRTPRGSSNNADKIGDGGGIYNKHPSPSLAKYPRDTDANSIPIKFAESGIGNAMRQTNQMRGAASRVKVNETLKDSGMDTSKNTLRGALTKERGK